MARSHGSAVRASAISRALEFVALKRRYLLIWLVLIAGIAVLAAPRLADPLGLGDNGVPTVIPALREWQGGSGYFTIGAASRIVLDPPAADQLSGAAQTFASDLQLVTGQTLPIVTTAKSAPGDFVLALSGPDTQLGNEGYVFAVSDRVGITAPTPTGVFYGTRTALQILDQASQHTGIPKGTARDWPAYPERGFMLDVGRKFFPLSELEGYVRLLAWYKMDDFQLHLNDNQLGVGVGPGWQSDYAAFRLNSPKFPGLAAKDGSYTQQDMRTLQDLAQQYHVTITPEIDAPAHSLAFTQFRPDLTNATLPKDMLDLSNPNTYTFLNSIWDEFLPWFDTNRVHIGADEYALGQGDAYHHFVDTYDDYLKAKGKSVEMWGSLAVMASSIPVETDMTVDIWDTSWADPVATAKAGFNVVNAYGWYLYIVPHSPSYQPVLDTKLLYDEWDPSTFDPAHPALNLPANDPHLQGAMFAEWNDRLAPAVSDTDVSTPVSAAVPVLGDKMWDGAMTVLSYDDFEAAAKVLGDGPGTTLP